MSYSQGLFGLPHWPPGSESSLQVLPGCFHASNQQPGRHAPSPCRPPPTARPHNKVWAGAPTVRGTLVLRRPAGLQARKELQVCDSSPPDSKSQSPMRFSYYPPNFSPSCASVFPPSFHSLLHFIKYPFQKVDKPYLNSAFV